MSFTENSYEVVIIELLKNLGYEYQYGPDIIRDYIFHISMINYGLVCRSLILQNAKML